MQPAKVNAADDGHTSVKLAPKYLCSLLPPYIRNYLTGLSISVFLLTISQQHRNAKRLKISNGKIMTIRRYQSRSISAIVGKLTRPIFGKRGFGQGTMIADWPNITGSVLAQHTFPEKITYPRGERGNGTLYLRIDSPALALELLHLEPQLLERINTHFGYRAVSFIKIIQGTLPEKPQEHEIKKRELTPTEKSALDERLNLISDPELKEVLRALGSEITTRD